MHNIRSYLLISLIFVVAMNTAACTQVAATPVVTDTAAATSAPTATVTAAPTISQEDSTRSLTVGDLDRSYVLHIPPGLDSSQPVPVLFAFHGAGSSAASMELSTGFSEIADKSGFVLVYPEGIGQTWNAGECCGYAAAENIDDIAFVQQILSDLETSLSVDRKRVYATGVSNGGAFVYRLACEMSDILAGIAPVAAAPVESGCQLQQPVSLIHIHGLDDSTVPYEGGGQFDAAPIEDTIAAWVKFNECENSPKIDNPINIVKHTAYSSCKAGTAVELLAIEFGGHAWPSMSVWSGSQAIWDFFAAHPKP